MEALSDDELRHKTVEFKERLDAGRGPRRPAGRGLRRRARGGLAGARAAPLRRPADGGHGPALRVDRRDEDRRGQDPGLDPARLPERPGRPGRPRGDRQRLPGHPRRRVDGPAPPLAGADRRPGRAPTSPTPRPKRAAYAADITYGTNTEFGFDYLRDNMARSRETMAQRGHAFAIIDEVDSILIDEARTPLIISGPADEAAKLYYQFAGIARMLDARRRLRGRRGEAPRRPPRGRHREGREGRGGGEPLRRRGHQLRAPADQGPRGQGALPPGQGVPGRRRRGEDRRRVHRPHPGGPALVRRPAPGGRGQGAGADQRGEPHLGHGHPPELLPPLREALGHDRHGRDRGRRVRQHLQPAGGAHPHQQAAGPRETSPTSSSRPRRPSSTRSSTTSSSARRPASRCWSARPRWPSPSCSPACWRSGASPTRSSTPSSTSGRPRWWPRPAGSAAITVATNMAGRGVDIILGGNAEMLARHEAVAQGVDLETDEGQAELKRLTAGYEASAAPRRASRSASSAASTCWAASATRAAASTTSSGAARAARATPARAAST